jgi:LmbE family N-acetylglucosaminyl deacetylase
MNTLPLSLAEAPILAVVPHPDDAEMHHAGLLARSQEGMALVATNGEASTIDFTRRSLCRP